MGQEKDTAARPKELTAKEHRARAMLMGLVYAQMGHYYMSPPDVRLIVRLDADTLEPLTSVQAFERYKQSKADRRGA